MVSLAYICAMNCMIRKKKRLTQQGVSRYSKLGRSYQYVASFQMHHQQDVLQDEDGADFSKYQIKNKLHNRRNNTN